MDMHALDAPAIRMKTEFQGQKLAMDFEDGMVWTNCCFTMPVSVFKNSTGFLSVVCLSLGVVGLILSSVIYPRVIYQGGDVGTGWSERSVVPLNSPDEALWLEAELLASVIPDTCNKLRAELCNCYTGCWVHGDDGYLHCEELNQGIEDHYQEKMLQVVGMGWAGTGRNNWNTCAGIMCAVHCQVLFECYTEEVKAQCVSSREFLSAARFALPFWEKSARTSFQEPACDVDCDSAAGVKLLLPALVVLFALFGYKI